MNETGDRVDDVNDDEELDGSLGEVFEDPVTVSASRTTAPSATGTETSRDPSPASAARRSIPSSTAPAR
jgi:hypothetical protein